MRKYQARGYLFEKLIERLLNKAGYEYLPPDVTPDRLKGRGALHQIDAFGKFWFQIPFVYPIRLIAEAKWLKRGARLHHLRDFVGVLKDVSENYFVGTETGSSEFDRLILQRYTDCGAFFSMTSFSIPAQRYAYAHGVFLINFKGSEIMEPIKNELEKKDVQKLLARAFQRNARSQAEKIFKSDKQMLKQLSAIGSYVGILDGIYPIHILTEGELRFDPKRPDDYRINPIQKQYMRNLGTEVVFLFRDDFETKIEFTIPRYILERMAERLRERKKRFFSFIDVPVRILLERPFRRIFSLSISEEDRGRILRNLKAFEYM